MARRQVQSKPSKHRQRQRHRPASLAVGHHVEGNFDGKGEWYPARIAKVNDNGTFNLSYADGDEESQVKPEMVRWADLFVMDLPFYDRNLNPYHHPDAPRWLTYASCYGPLRRHIRLRDWVAIYYKGALRTLFRVDSKIPYERYMTPANAAADALYYHDPQAANDPQLGRFRKKQGGAFCHVHQNITPKDQPKDMAGSFVLASYTWNTHRPGFAAGTHPVPPPPNRNYEIHLKVDVSELLDFIQSPPVPMGHPPKPNIP